MDDNSRTGPGPPLAVVLPTDTFETVRRVVEAFRAQGDARQLELVLVSEADVAVDAETRSAFGRVEVVRIEPGGTLAQARSAGIAAAKAPYVFLGETHVFPRRGFADVVLAAHAEGWVGVEPAVGNANPDDGALSWAGALLDYGRRFDLPAGEAASVDIYNSSYRREALLELGPQLVDMLEPGGGLGPELRRRGHRLVNEPRAHVDHLNIARLRSWLVERYLSGHGLGSARARRWSPARRAVYSLGAPLIPVVYLSRAIRETGLRRRVRSLPPLTFPAMMLGSAAWAVGELAGYVAPRAVGRRMRHYELHKEEYTRGAA
ncbi:MAG: hypothetical protein QOE36_52 [Gaiellaceae bacterium]|nr:hypothetical protein [Gaiellaceae bacterium]